MLTPQELTFLSQTFLFAGCTAEHLADLLQPELWQKQHFTKGSVIFSPGDFRQELAIILSGRILVTKGDGDLVVSELNSGDLFGAGALFNDAAEYVSTLTARTHCDVLFFPQSAVHHLIDAEPIIRHNYIRYLSCRIRFLSDKIDSLISGSGEKKLASWLLHHMDDSGCITPGCPMTELAARLNISRASLYRELQKLEDRGILSRHGKTITVHRPQELGTPHLA